MKRLIVTLASVSLISCATVDQHYSPVIDMQGVDRTQLSKDLSECREYAKQRMDAQQGAVAGAIAGAVLGVAFGAIFGLDGRDLTRAAGAGALGGGIGAAGGANQDQKSIVANCLVGRGYRVLGQ